MSVEIKVKGNLGQNFDLRPVQSPSRDEPSMVLNFSIASTRYKKTIGEDGKPSYTQESVEWIECEYWNRNAAHLHKLLQKGMPVVAFGEERMETYVNRDGDTVRARRLRVNELLIQPTERIQGISLRPAKEFARSDDPDTANESGNPY